MKQLRAKLIKKVSELGVEDRPWPDRDDGFSALFFNGKEFAHFHNDNELDIRLTKKMIASEGLEHPPDSVTHPTRSPKSPWIELRFTKAAQLDEIVRLVGVAIKNL